MGDCADDPSRPDDPVDCNREWFVPCHDFATLARGDHVDPTCRLGVFEMTAARTGVMHVHIVKHDRSITISDLEVKGFVATVMRAGNLVEVTMLVFHASQVERPGTGNGAGAG
jgi:hypothetical protein